MKLPPLGDAAWFRSEKDHVQRCWAMGVQIIQHQAIHGDVWISLTHQLRWLVGDQRQLNQSQGEMYISLVRNICDHSVGA